MIVLTRRLNQEAPGVAPVSRNVGRKPIMSSQKMRRQSNPEYFVSRWLVALELEDARIRDTNEQLHRQIDTDIYALVLRNLVRAVEYANKIYNNDEIRKALEVFKSAVPGWLNVRDFLEHFDEYAQESGRLQKRGKAVVYGPFYVEEEKHNPDGCLSSTNYYLSFGEGNQIDILTATREAKKLAEVAISNASNA